MSELKQTEFNEKIDYLFAFTFFFFIQLLFWSDQSKLNSQIIIITLANNWQNDPYPHQRDQR